ncbi:DUF2798 domain-containing protein [Zobellella taiwanensis]
MIFPRRYARLVFSVLMSIYMVTLMTGVITWANTGLSGNFLARWDTPLPLPGPSPLC